MSQSSPTKNIDVAGQVRDGEGLPIATLDPWLKSHIDGLAGDPEVTQYSGGASNWTYRLAYPSHDLILRRPPAGTKAKSAHDMGREYRVQKALKPVYPYVPDMLAFCEDDSIIGDEFYVMERLVGIIPRKNMPRGLSLSETDTRALCISVLDKLIDLHKVDTAAAGLESLGKGSGYVERQITGWSGRFKKAKTWNVAGFAYVMDWLQERMPADVANCVIHNDFRFDNVVLAPDDPMQVIGVLDWEMATLGDPLMDLGNSLAYWVQADDDKLIKAMRRQPTHLPGMLTRQEVIEYYLANLEHDIENFAFYECYGLFRLAVIIQQIYYRYHHKQTRNPQFKNFWIMVNYLYWRCRQVIKRSQ